MKQLKRGLKELMEAKENNSKLEVLFESKEKLRVREPEKRRCKKCGREIFDYEICLCDEYIKREELIERIALMKKYQSVRVIDKENRLEEISTVSINDLMNLIEEL